MGPRLELRSEIRLSHEQRLELDRLLKFEQQLRRPPSFEATLGLEGMSSADELLKEKGVVGLLIGGLSEEVWRSEKTRIKLTDHKDVDVLVTNLEFSLDEIFQNGIDWWLPKEETFSKIKTRNGTPLDNVHVRWIENGNGIALHYFPHFVNEDYLKPGLYIPDPDLVAKIKAEETLAVANGQGLEPDYSVAETLQKRIRRRMTVQLHSDVKRLFPVLKEYRAKIETLRPEEFSMVAETDQY